MSDQVWCVFVRWQGDKRAERLAPDGCTTTRRVHAAMIRDKVAAQSAADRISQDERVSAAWVGAF